MHERVVRTVVRVHREAAGTAMVSGRRSSKAALLAMQAGSGVLLVLGAVTLALHGRRSTVLAGKISAVVDIESRTFAKQAGVYDRVLQQTSAAASRHDVSTVLRDIKAQQAAVEAQMKHLMHVNRAKASALSRVLNGDKFSAGLAARAYKAHASSATPTKLKLHPRSGRPIAVGTARPQNHKARAAGEPRASGGVATSDVAAAGGRGGAAGAVRAAAVALGKESGPSRVQTRIARLLADAQARLSQDEHSTLKDLTSMPERGPWFQAQQALSLDGDRRRVLGDERLVKLLRGMKASPSLLGSQNALVQHLDAIDMQARDDLQAAEMRARQRGIADEVNPHTKNILAAGVNPGHSRDMGLGGMEGDDEDFGTEALQRAGIRTDALPGMGSEVSYQSRIIIIERERERDIYVICIYIYIYIYMNMKSMLSLSLSLSLSYHV